MPLNLERYLGCVCELRTMQNALVAVGVVKSAEEEYIVLTGTSHQKLPLIAYNMQLKAAILGRDDDFIILVGHVFTSTDTQLKLSEINTLEQYERRNFFRVNVRVPVQMLRVASDDEAQEKPQTLEARLLDISLGGCLIETDAELALGVPYQVEFVLLQVRHEVLLNVFRLAQPAEGSSKLQKFGCAFEGNSERKMDAICKDLFSLQRKAIHSRLRD